MKNVNSNGGMTNTSKMRNSLKLSDINDAMNNVREHIAEQRAEIVAIIKDKNGKLLAHCKIPSVRAFASEDRDKQASDVLTHITKVVNNMGMSITDVKIEIAKINT